ncbi:MAG: hypothetical protein V3T77_02270 [Planctomycetota bacterium]
MRRTRMGISLVGFMTLVMVSGCLTAVNTVGDGPHGGEVRVHRTWYAAWGFLPVNRLDSRDLVGGADDYRITASFRTLDIITNLFTLPFSFLRRTTVVEK